MAFIASKYNIETWLEHEFRNVLQKTCTIYDASGLKIEEYKTRVSIVPVGKVIPGSAGVISLAAPSLYRAFTYGTNGQEVASLPEMREWTQDCEDAAYGSPPPHIGDPGTTPGVPAGLLVAVVDYEYGEASLIYNETKKIGEYIVPEDETHYLRRVIASGGNIAEYIVKKNGVTLAKKRSWWTAFNVDFNFSSADGGIIMESDDIITVYATNNHANSVADFESTIQFVKS